VEVRQVARATGEGQRRAVVAAATPQARPRVRDFSGGAQAQTVSFDPRTAFDFLISAEIGRGEESDLQPEDRDWLKRSREALGDDVRTSLDACFGEESKGIFHGLASMLVDDTDVHTGADVLKVVDAAGPRGIARVVIRDSVTQPVADELIERVLNRDQLATEELQPHLSEWLAGEVAEFLGKVDQQFDTMRASLAAWLPYFQQIEGRVARFQERDVSSRRSEQRTLDAGQLIERVTGGLRWIPESKTKRVVLAPSYFSRPYNYVYQGRDWRLFAYPIADSVLDAADTSTPPSSIVRLYRALGDQTRLRTLKLLSERDWYLTELATQLELSKPTMKHHLAQMRAAGLVTVTEEGSLTYYSLRRERLAEAGVELSRFIG
jgi:DNA-binding transcriptional ArsR family regulator